MSDRTRFPCTPEKASHVLHCVKVLGWKQTRTAIFVGLNGGTVSKVVRGLRHPNARPVPPPNLNRPDRIG